METVVVVVVVDTLESESLGQSPETTVNRRARLFRRLPRPMDDESALDDEAAPSAGESTAALNAADAAVDVAVTAVEASKSVPLKEREMRRDIEDN